jgi:mannose-6-phosphate isomerase-like protein (cupin superfamily)
VVLICILVAFPILAGSYIGQVMMLVSLFVLMGMGLNIEVGLAGLLDMGFVAFFAVGAYAIALLTADSEYALAQYSFLPALNFWTALPVAVLAATTVGVLFGLPVLSVKGDYLATGKSTDGDFGLYRWNFGPNETGPGPHFHRTIAESFYIISGSVRVYDGEEWVTTRPGDFLHVPPGGLHGFRNESGEPASMLLHFAPGAPREAYFEGLDRLGRGEEWTQEQYDAFMTEHDNIWVE